MLSNNFISHDLNGLAQKHIAEGLGTVISAK